MNSSIAISLDTYVLQGNEILASYCCRACEIRWFRYKGIDTKDLLGGNNPDVNSMGRGQSMSLEFIGSLGELKKLVEEKGFIGKWSPQKLITGGTKHIFRDKDGGVLTWWESSGKVLFQGKTKASQELLDSMRQHLREAKPTQEARASETADEYDE